MKTIRCLHDLIDAATAAMARWGDGLAGSWGYRVQTQRPGSVEPTPSGDGEAGRREDPVTDPDRPTVSDWDDPNPQKQFRRHENLSAPGGGS